AAAAVAAVDRDRPVALDPTAVGDGPDGGGDRGRRGGLERPGQVERGVADLRRAPVAHVELQIGKAVIAGAGGLDVEEGGGAEVGLVELRIADEAVGDGRQDVDAEEYAAFEWFDADHAHRLGGPRGAGLSGLGTAASEAATRIT